MSFSRKSSHTQDFLDYNYYLEGIGKDQVTPSFFYTTISHVYKSNLIRHSSE